MGYSIMEGADELTDAMRRFADLLKSADQVRSRPLAVVLTGAGISAESGLKTFRDADGLWENHSVHEVASIEGWHRNPELVLKFYNERRAQLGTVRPNPGHEAIVALEQGYDVVVVTQNVDNLHERAGSSRVLHLHGELQKVRSTVNPRDVRDIGTAAIALGDMCPLGGQLRPHIVWFGEDVPLLPLAAALVGEADLVLIVGTSLAVYPAAGLADYAKDSAPKFYVDPRPAPIRGMSHLTVIAEKSGAALPKLVQSLLQKL